MFKVEWPCVTIFSIFRFMFTVNDSYINILLIFAIYVYRRLLHRLHKQVFNKFENDLR